MLSFRVITEENAKEQISELSLLLSDSDDVFEILHGMLECMDEDMELAATASDGCLLLRVFDMGRYVFPFPYEISEDADVLSAVLKISEYAMREEISPVFTDVPPEAVALFIGYRHMDIDAENGEELSYRIRIKTECELLSEIPEVSAGRVSLSAISDDDKERYAALCKDRATQKYWGYNYLDDVGEDVSDSYFLESARTEFENGVSLSAAVRYDGEFVGEAVIYAFDGRGGAEFAVRIFSDCFGHGIGSLATEATINLARRIGLRKLRALIMEENVASIKMAEKFMEREETSGARVLFSLDI